MNPGGNPIHFQQANTQKLALKLSTVCPVLSPGLEPGTYRLGGDCSVPLSYESLTSPGALTTGEAVGVFR